MLGARILRTLGQRSGARLDRSLPFVNVDYVFSKFPNLTRDKVVYMSNLLAYSFIAGVVTIFVLIDAPYKGADYENAQKSLYYQWRHRMLEKSGQLYENTRVKREHFYSPGSPVDPMVKTPESNHD